MTVALPFEKKDNLIKILKHWHIHRNRFVIKEASSLLGKLNYAAKLAPWTRLLFVAIRSSLLNCMRKNKKIVMTRARFKQYIADANDPNDDFISLLRRKFALNKLAKPIWNSNAKCFITKTLRAELNLLYQIIEDNSINWTTPIAYFIKRSLDFQVWGDSSLQATGGYSLDLGFYWHLQ